MRIPCTLVDSFDRYVRGLKDEAELVAQIRGAFSPTRRILIGRDYDAILEDPDRHRVVGGYAGPHGFRFEAAAVDPALAVIDRRGLTQVKHTRLYHGHTVVAKVDWIRGLAIDEYKTRLGDFDPDRYASGLQWKFELDIFGAVSVRFRVFRLNDRLQLLSDPCDELTLYPTSRLHSECAAAVEAFVTFVTRRGLEVYLPDDGLRGPAFEDGPTRPSAAPRLRALREQVRARRAIDVLLPIVPTVLQELAPVAALPDPAWSLRPTPRGRPLQPRLF